jgi:hypothetical protein
MVKRVPDAEPVRELVNVVKVGEREVRWFEDDDMVHVEPLYRVLEADEPIPPDALPATFDHADGRGRRRLTIYQPQCRATLEELYARQDSAALRESRARITADNSGLELK